MRNLYSSSPTARSRFRDLAIWLSLLAGCAHRLTAEETTAGFRALQRHEANLARAEAERGQLVLAREDCTSASRQATDTVCEQSSALCSVAQQLADRDAKTRCLRSQDSCRAAREHVRVRCATQAR